MSGDVAALKEAQQKVKQLLEAAETGAIIPRQLPGQIEEIAALLNRTDDAIQAASAAAIPPDIEAYMQEEAHFVGHAVHELRTPMTSIRGYTDMIGQMGELSDMQKQFLDVIKTNAHRMETLLADVSYINKIRKGTLKLQPKMDLFKNIALKIEKDLKKRADALNRKLEFDVPQGLPLLNVDSELLGVALEKLVENGLQYSPEGEGIVRVSGSADGNKLLISIEDNGIGMSEEELARLGTIYFRGENDFVREYKGSGLGIPIAFGMLELLGATVDVESAPGNGTTFTISIEGMT